jgi:hypothetical protein
VSSKTHIEFEGERVDAQEVSFEVEQEPFNTYRLEDGTVVKIKTILTRALRLNKYKDDGDPVYVINAGTLVTTIVPEKLKRTKQAGRKR